MASIARTIARTALPLNRGIGRHVEALIRRHGELQTQIAAGEFSVSRARELARLEPVAAAHAQLSETAAEVAGLLELSADSDTEAELRELARVELKVAGAALEEQRVAFWVGRSATRPHVLGPQDEVGPPMPAAFALPHVRARVRACRERLRARASSARRARVRAQAGMCRRQHPAARTAHRAARSRLLCA